MQMRSGSNQSDNNEQPRRKTVNNQLQHPERCPYHVLLSAERKVEGHVYVCACARARVQEDVVQNPFSVAQQL